MSQRRRLIPQLLVLSLPLLAMALAFQNCGDVSISAKVLDASSESPPGENLINGILCNPSAAEGLSIYSLSDFYAINLTATKLNGNLVADSDMDGILDSSIQSPRDTVTISEDESSEDGLPDFVKTLKGLNPSRADADEDLDYDGVSNRREVQMGTDPQSPGDEPSVIYTVQSAGNSVTGCGSGQPAYRFSVQRMRTVATKAFTDSVNSDPYSLSHAENENVIMILARLSPANSSLNSIYLAKIFRLNHLQLTELYFSPSQFLILGESTSECGTCSAASLGNLYTKVFSGSKHSCALSTTQRAFCWGSNSSGQLGDGSVLPRLNIVAAKLDANITQMALGREHTCALTANQEVYCWGGNSYGQLGNGTNTDSVAPVKVDLGENALMISAGSYHTCASVQSGKLKCWGRNDLYQLGNQSTTSSSTPVSLVIPSGMYLQFPLKSLSSGGNYNCLVDNATNGYCWGTYGSYKITHSSLFALPGNPDTHPGVFPTDGFRSPYSFVSLVTNGLVNAAIKPKEDGNGIICWDTSIAQAAVPCGQPSFDSGGVMSSEFMFGLTKVAKLSMGVQHSCALVNGLINSAVVPNIQCWGSNDYGQLGRTVQAGEPATRVQAPVSEIVKPLDISSGDYFSCAIDQDHAIWCWGENSYGQLGSGNIQSPATPAKVQGQ